jgi:hypothetical protein
MNATVKHGIQFFLYSTSPAARARRALWIKFVVAISGGVMWALIAAEFEAWFAQHTFLTPIIIAVAVAAWLAFTVAWHSSVPCPNCGWNINLSKDKYGLRRRTLRVPSFCPNCGTDLTVP